MTTSPETSGVDVPDFDLAFRNEVMTYLVERYERASVLLREGQWEAFREFVQIWLDTFDWRTPEGVQRYLSIAEEPRRERFARFRRQAESWDVTLEFPATTTRKQPTEEDRASAERARWREEYKRRKERFQQRTAAGRTRWESVRDMLEAEHALRMLPDHLREAYALLGLPPKVSLADARKRYRELAKRLHPDVSGSQSEMQALNDAWQKIVAWFLA